MSKVQKKWTTWRQNASPVHSPGGSSFVPTYSLALASDRALTSLLLASRTISLTRSDSGIKRFLAHMITSVFTDSLKHSWKFSQRRKRRSNLVIEHSFVVAKRPSEHMNGKCFTSLISTKTFFIQSSLFCFTKRKQLSLGVPDPRPSPSLAAPSHLYELSHLITTFAMQESPCYLGSTGMTIFPEVRRLFYCTRFKGLLTVGLCWKYHDFGICWRCPGYPSNKPYFPFFLWGFLGF